LQAKTTHNIKKAVGRQDYQRAFVAQDDEGNLSVTPLSAQDSHRIKQLSQANCLLVLPQDNAGVTAGEWVTIEPFSWNF
jgi:molybdopterin molybdotransferase